MSSKYVEPRASRHRVELVDGVEQLRIPVRRQWFAIAFLPFWLAGWTVGGIVAMWQLSQDFDLFLLFWLGAWAVGWLFVAGTLFGQAFGAEIVRVVDRDLEISTGVFPLKRTWRYRGDAIRNLMGWSADRDWFGMRSFQQPFFMRPKTGAVKFDYGADSIFLGAGVDEPEGRAIASWLEKRLPRSAALAYGEERGSQF